MGSPDPLSIKECVPPVKKVLKRLSRGKPFPVCTLENGLDSSTSGSYVTHKPANPTPPCPDGYRQGDDNVVYHRGQKPSYVNPQNLQGGTTSEKFDEDDFQVKLFGGDRYKQRVCIKGSPNGFVAATTSRKKDVDPTPRHEWYDDVQSVTPDNARYEFNMFVDGKLFSTHRF